MLNGADIEDSGGERRADDIGESGGVDVRESGGRDAANAVGDERHEVGRCRRKNLIVDAVCISRGQYGQACKRCTVQGETREPGSLQAVHARSDPLVDWSVHGSRQ